MNKRSIANQGANIRVLSVFDTYPNDVAKMDSFATHVARFRLLVTSISDLWVAIRKIPPSTSSAKTKARRELETICLQCSCQLWVFVNERKDLNFRGILKTNKTALRRMRCSDFRTYSKVVEQYIANNAEEVVSVGISKELQLKFSEITDKYDKLLQDPRQRSNERKILLTEMKQKLKKTTKMLNEVFDHLILSYDAYSPFVTDYKAARVVVKPATIHRKDEEDNEQNTNE